MGRTLAVDWGGKRLGLALSDPLDLTAQPLDTVHLAAPADAASAIARVVSEHDVSRIVLGLPLELSGATGEAARQVLALATELERALGIPVETWDERFTSVIAERSLREEGIRAAHRKGGGRERARARAAGKARVDRRAAILLLQSWLDARRARPEGV